eukprot:gene14154-18928_t
MIKGTGQLKWSNVDTHQCYHKGPLHWGKRKGKSGALWCEGSGGRDGFYTFPDEAGRQELEEAWTAVPQALNLRVGSRVEAFHQEDEKWYPAKLVNWRDDSDIYGFTVDFDQKETRHRFGYLEGQDDGQDGKGMEWLRAL